MKSFYDPKKPEATDYNSTEGYLDTFKNDWHVGQCYDDNPCEQYRCKGCGATTFEVGNGSYFTALRCVNCKYELDIHNG